MSTELETIKIETLPAEVQDAIQKSGVPHEEAQAYIARFLPFMNKLSELEAEIKDINHENPTAEDAKKARALRLKYVPNRTGAEKEKKTMKELILIKGRIIDSLYNLVENTSKLKEKHLEDIEKRQERIEKAAKDQLRTEREAELGKYVENPSIYPLGELDEIAWKQLLEGQIAVFEKREAQDKLDAITKEREDLLRPFMEIPTTFSLGSISQESFDDLLSKSKVAHQEKLDAENFEREKQKRTNDRIQKLSSLGFTYSPNDSYSRSFVQDGINLIEYSKAELENDKPDVWEANIKRISEIVDEEKKAIAYKNELKKQLLKKRMTSVAQYILPSLATAKFEEWVSNMDEAEFDEYLGGIKKTWEEKQEADKTAKELADRKKADEIRNAELAAAAERDAMMGDKDKFKKLINDVKAIIEQPLEFKSKKYTGLLMYLRQQMGDTVEALILKNK